MSVCNYQPSEHIELMNDGLLEFVNCVYRWSFKINEEQKVDTINERQSIYEEFEKLKDKKTLKERGYFIFNENYAKVTNAISMFIVLFRELIFLSKAKFALKIIKR